ncbi:hypothetical protein [Ornithinimicrobium murale]|uniref:hypothetical protein n=1 Tax=Ornithinimicrobium murale TaxID=1050153 RepID=UPI000E0DC410|nr:hypothetical protein [Ornithinimicrobium murale]
MTAPQLRRRAGEVVANRPLGSYRQLSIVLPPLATPARPGQFVLAPPDTTDRVLPRAWWIAGERTEAGFGSTIDVVLPEGDPHSAALPQAGDRIDLTGPLGRGFGAAHDSGHGRRGDRGSRGRYRALAL